MFRRRVARATIPGMPDIPDTPFTLAEAASFGLSRQVLRDLVEARAVRRVLRNVYVRSDLEDTVETRALWLPPRR